MRKENYKKWIQFNIRTLITREDETPYLYRWTLVRVLNLFSLKIHRIVASDDACSHDHPWPFLSIILRGGYYEWRPIDRERDFTEIGDDSEGLKSDIIAWQTGKDNVVYVMRWHGPGSILYRRAKDIHRLELKQTGLPTPYMTIPATTFVITFNKIRSWGFHTLQGFIPWRKYSKQQHCE